MSNVSKNPRFATISDVAKKARAGKTSISRYLNGELHLLSDDLQKRIEFAISELNYRPNQMARSLKHGRTGLIGLIIADISNPYSIEVLKGVEAETIKHGIMTVLCNSNNNIRLESEFIHLLKGYRVDGLIIHSAGMNNEFLEVLKSTTLPFVLLDRKIKDFPCDMIGLDNPHAANLAFNHLLDQGYEALCLITEPVALISSRQERLESFDSFLHQTPQIRGESHQITLPNEQELENIIADFCARHRGMRKAVIAANGVLTLHVAHSLSQLGLRWGTDIGFLSFDNLEWAALAGTGITSISQPTAKMGRKAVELLLERLTEPDKKPEQNLFNCELIIRKSTTL